MNPIEILTRQTQDAYNWTDKLVNSVSYDKWEDIPIVIETNLSWQVGHLIMSIYYHSIMVIVGHQMDVIHKIPMREYDKLLPPVHQRMQLEKQGPKN